MRSNVDKVIMGSFVALILGLIGCGSGGDGGGSVTPVVITEANNKVAYDKAVLPFNDIYSRWKSADQVANVTSRIALSGPVTNLQNIKREADALVVAKCLSTAKTDMSQGMDKSIRGYLDFMGGGSFSYLWTDGAKVDFTQYEKDLLNQKLCDFSIM